MEEMKNDLTATEKVVITSKCLDIAGISRVTTSLQLREVKGQRENKPLLRDCDSSSDASDDHSADDNEPVDVEGIDSDEDAGNANNAVGSKPDDEVCDSKVDSCDSEQVTINKDDAR